MTSSGHAGPGSRAHRVTGTAAEWAVWSNVTLDGAGSLVDREPAHVRGCGAHPSALRTGLAGLFAAADHRWCWGSLGPRRPVEL